MGLCAHSHAKTATQKMAELKMVVLKANIKSDHTKSDHIKSSNNKNNHVKRVTSHKSQINETTINLAYGTVLSI